MREIKSIDKKSLAKVTALFYGLPGVIFFIAFLIFALANVFTATDLPVPLWKAVLFLIGFSIVLGLAAVLISTALGWVIGYLSAMVYNLAAPHIGGVKMELEETDSEKQQHLI